MKIETEFKVTPIKGISPIIIDYCNYKITILMYKGATIKFFRLYENRWYKVKDVSYDYFQIDECITWAKNAIDNNSAWFEESLSKQIRLKNRD